MTSVERGVSLRDGSVVPATWLTPATRGPHPAWIALHGITRPGRAHPTLLRFARALVSSGAVVVIPEVPTWRKLDLAPGAATPVVRATVDLLESEPDVRGAPGLIGFSFGGPQVIRMAADPALGPRLAGVASFGGFADIEALFRFQMTGRVGTDTAARAVRPDPYARWVVTANYLTAAAGGEAYGPVADALRRLASTAGDRGIPSWEPVYDPLKSELESELPTSQRGLFRLFAPPAADDPASDHAEVELWIDRLVKAARRVEPALELPAGLELLAPAHILHGRNDVLIPWTEAERLAAKVDAPAPPVTVTGLFSHSGRDSGGRIADGIEAVRLANALRRVLDIP